MSDIIKESFIEFQPIPVSLEATKDILYQMENCICKIHCNNDSTGTGFFCEIPFQNNSLPILVTNNHVLNEEDIKNGKIIKLTINEKTIKIQIDNSRITYTNPELDVTFIEIKLNKDEINENNFLKIDENYLKKKKEFIENNYNKKSIYILHYPKGDLRVSYGLIKNVSDENIYHYCNTERGSSGSPILS